MCTGRYVTKGIDLQANMLHRDTLLACKSVLFCHETPSLESVLGRIWLSITKHTLTNSALPWTKKKEEKKRVALYYNDPL